MSELPEPSGEIRMLRSDSGILTVEHADPVMWFAKHTLDDLKAEPDPEPGWAFDGSLVTLDVANGRWIWKLTGRTWIHRYDSPYAKPLVMCEGRWPD